MSGLSSAPSAASSERTTRPATAGGAAGCALRRRRRATLPASSVDASHASAALLRRIACGQRVEYQRPRSAPVMREVSRSPASARASRAPREFRSSARISASSALRSAVAPAIRAERSDRAACASAAALERLAFAGEGGLHRFERLDFLPQGRDRGRRLSVRSVRGLPVGGRPGLPGARGPRRSEPPPRRARARPPWPPARAGDRLSQRVRLNIVFRGGLASAVCHACSPPLSCDVSSRSRASAARSAASFSARRASARPATPRTAAAPSRNPRNDCACRAACCSPRSRWRDSASANAVSSAAARAFSAADAVPAVAACRVGGQRGVQPLAFGREGRCLLFLARGRVHQRPLEAPVLGDVAEGAECRGQRVGGAGDRDRMNLQRVLKSCEAGEFDLGGAAIPVRDPLQKREALLAVVGCDEREQRSLENLFQPLGAEQRHRRLVHGEERSVVRDAGQAHRLAFENLEEIGLERGVGGALGCRLDGCAHRVGVYRARERPSSRCIGTAVRPEQHKVRHPVAPAGSDG